MLNKMNKILVTSTDLMMVQFLVPHIKYLCSNGYRVDVLCSNVGGRVCEVKEELKDYAENFFEVSLQRSPLSIKNLSGYFEVKRIINKNQYDFIWTNEPVMGVATRLAAKRSRQRGTKVMYMVHGFHFYNGAPKANWMIFYSIEKMMAKYCDIITTINNEDFEMAKQFKAQDAKYIHGIGINTDRLNNTTEQKNIREEIGLSKEDFIVLSVGELNENKNHRVIIRALAQLNDKSIHYVICGKGDQLNNLISLSKELGVESNVHFLGYRTDVVDIFNQSDLFAFPTYREGLGLAALEAMYCGLPLVTSNSRGPVDFMKNGETGYICDPNKPEEFAKAISDIKSDKHLRIKMSENNKKIAKPFCFDNVKNEVLELIKITIGD